MKNLLLVDSSVLDYETFVQSVNSDTIPFVYHSTSTIRQELLEFLKETTLDRIGIVFTTNALFLEGESFFSESNVSFIQSMIQQFHVKNIDYLACNTLQVPEWNTYYAKVAETGVVVGASNNQTGNLQYGGDWTMESTCQDIELVYFTQGIEYYKYLLDPPTITSITRNGLTGLITIKGTNFYSPIVTLTFGNSVQIVSATSTTIACTQTNTFDEETFTVSSGGTSSVPFPATFPVITSIKQDVNKLVTLYGNHLNTTNSLQITGCIVSSISEIAQIQVKFTTNLYAGTALVKVTTSGGIAYYDAYLPKITSISKDASGVLTVNGMNFLDNNVIITIPGIYYNGVPTTNPNQFTFSPPSFTTNVTLELFSYDANTTVAYTTVFPTITTITPSSGPRNTRVVITGENLGNVTSVLFGTVPGTDLVTTPTTIAVTAPANIQSVFLTLSDGTNNILSVTPFEYNTNPLLLTTNASDPGNNLLTRYSLTDGIAGTGVIQIGSSLTTTNLSGTTVNIQGPNNINITGSATTTIGHSGNILNLNSGTITASGTLKTNTIRGTTTNGAITIGTDQTAGGTLVLGTVNSSTTINGTLITNTIRGTTTNGAITIGGDQTAGGTLVIGASNSSTTINGRINVKTNGFVGIGTTTPAYPLEVIGNARCSGDLYLGTNITSNASGQQTAAAIRFAGTIGDTDNYAAIGGYIASRRYTTAADSEKSEMIIFKGNDNGLGTFSYAGPDRIRLRAGQLAFDTYSAESADPSAESIRMIVNANGSVGINTTAPAYLLDVNGSTQVKGSLYVSDLRSLTSTTAMNIGTNLASATAINIGNDSFAAATLKITGSTSINTTQNHSLSVGNGAGNITMKGAIRLNDDTDATGSISIGNTNASSITTLKSYTINCGQNIAGTTTNVIGAIVNVSGTTVNVSGTVNVRGPTTFSGSTNTFTTNIVTNSVEAPLLSSTQTIGSNLTTGSLAIANGLTTGSVNIATAGTGTPACNVNVLKSGGTGKLIVAGGGIASAKYDSTSATIPMSVGSSLTSGNMDIGGLMDIGSINLMTGAQTSGNINALKIGGTGKLIVSGGGIQTDDLQARTSTSSSIQNIMTTKTGGQINIGNTNVTTNINGTTIASLLRSTNYDTTGATIPMKVGTSLTTGSLTVGDKLTSGGITMGNQSNTYAQGSTYKNGNYKLLEDGVNVFGNRTIKHSIGEIPSNQLWTDQLVYNAKQSMAIDGTSFDIFKISMNTANTPAWPYNATGQNFELNINGNTNYYGGLVGRYTFYIQQYSNNNSGTLPSPLVAIGNAYSVGTFSFRNLADPSYTSIVLSYTPSSAAGQASAVFSLRAFATFNSHYYITPL